MGVDDMNGGASNRRALIAGAAAAVTGIGIGVGATKIVDSKEDSTEGPFTIVDRRGQQRFRLDTSKAPVVMGGRTYPASGRGGPDEGSYLVFNDENGDEKGGIVAHSGGTLIALDYPNGDAIHLQTRTEGDRGRASFSLNRMGDPQKPIEEAEHPVGVKLFADTEEGAGLTLHDAQGRPRIRLHVAADGTPSIAVLDENGNIVKQL
ncbi:hypothetical protein V7968_28930 [Nocardia vulneris]|uniref:hypothetical protein n=1 Tax=Nocardia vulneris TaxID=1141657 RepID=UPI0030CFB122